MRAITQVAFGQASSALRLSSIPRPVPNTNEVLLRILASSVNALDVRMVSGYGRRFFERRLRGQPSCFLGRDAVGVVVECGSAVQSGLRVGSRVAVASLPIQGSGFWAEFATAPAMDCALLPNSIPDETAAALPYASLTALQSLRNRVFPGSRVLVHGGAGGVGHMALQSCVAAGAVVSATCTSQQQAFVLQLGAIAAYDFQDSNWLSSCGQFDVILDTVGGVVTQLSVKLLSPGGVVVCLAGDVVKNIDSHGIFAGLMASAKQWMSLQPHLHSPQVVWHMNKADGDTLREAVKMLSSGQLKPRVERRLKLDEIISHVHMMQQGGESSYATGKTIVGMQQ